ncbi:MAG: transcriptional repressor [Oscillospiraceae bacterium]|nr:transcriptional repressor [Oscillospiraceae bacterium]
MTRPTTYNTKQREAIVNYIISLEGAHVTAAQIVKHFGNEAVSIGRTTVYRYLDKMTENGELQRYTTDGISGACYQYIKQRENCQDHLHLKCEGCGKLQHLECNAMGDIKRHVFYSHFFEVNSMKTVLYGMCDNCLHKT